MATDHHLALGVHPNASPAEIRTAYLRLMRANHPDRRPGDPAAAATARRANAAYRALRDATPDGAGTGGRPAPAGAARTPRATATAYSAVQREYRAAFTRGCLRVGVAVLAVGAILLLALP